MSTLLVVSHEDGLFEQSTFMVRGMIPHWRAAGHTVHVREGLADLPPADLAFLHVDLTRIPADYARALARYPRVVNGATRDIDKRSVSANLVARGDGYSGPVIIKTDLNSGGMPEAFLNRQAIQKGRPPATPRRVMRGRYPVLDSVDDVPAEVWLDPDLVVEKFLPERDPRGYAMRVWIFLGDRERCTRLVGPHPVVKGSDVIVREPGQPVPDELRAARARLGFDYGKFDFVLHEGRVVLLDVNRTPTVPANLSRPVAELVEHLAGGVDALLREAVHS